VVAAAAAALVGWLAGSSWAGRPEPVAAGGSGPEAARSAVAGLRIEAGGRLSLERGELPRGRPLLLALAVSDEGRGTSLRTVRVVSTDGRRVDTTAVPLPGRGSGLQLGIDPDFLSPGRYLIEVDTVSSSPLRLQRFVLEVR